MGDNGEVIAAINTAVGQLRTDVKTDISAVRSDVKDEIATVHGRISELSRTTGEFEKKAIEKLAKIEQFQVDCPIDDVAERLIDAEKDARDAKREARRLSVLIAGGISSVIAGAGVLTRWLGGGDK